MSNRAKKGGMMTKKEAEYYNLLEVHSNARLAKIACF